MELLISSAAVFLLAHFLASPATPTDTANTEITANWSADVRTALGTEPLGLVVGRGRETHLQPKTSLHFLDNKTIAATFVTREGKPSLSSRANSDANLPLRLRAIFLDADTGRIIATHAWSSDSRFAGMVTAIGGRFVTQRGTMLTLYSSDGEELKKLSLPPLQSDLWGWVGHPSPSGKNVLFATVNLTKVSPTSWIWVDTATLDVAHSWEEMQSGWVGISDNAIAMTACVIWIYHCDPKVEIRGLTTQWNTIMPLEKRSGQFPQFVNQDTLFLSGKPWKLLRSDGRIATIGSTSFEGSTVVTAAGGQRFIVPFFQSRGGAPAFDIGAHGELKALSIYDAPFHERSYRLQVKGPKLREEATLALSPDGSKLAVLYEELIYFFQLPPAPAAKHTAP